MLSQHAYSSFYNLIKFKMLVTVGYFVLFLSVYSFMLLLLGVLYLFIFGCGRVFLFVFVMFCFAEYLVFLNGYMQFANRQDKNN